LASGPLAVIVPAPPAIRTPGGDKASPRAVIALGPCAILRRRETAVKRIDVAEDQGVPPLGEPLTHDLQERLTGGQGLLQRGTAVARQILREVLVGGRTFTPRCDGNSRYYEFAGQASLSGMLAGVLTTDRDLLGEEQAPLRVRLPGFAYPEGLEPRPDPGAAAPA
jgi:hypothetical protein